MTDHDIRIRLAGLGEVVNTMVTFTMRKCPPNAEQYANCWCAEIELPCVTSLDYDVMLKIAQHLGTTNLKFQSAYEGGYYGEVDNIVRIWAVWP